MEKKMYWLIENNCELSVTIRELKTAEVIIENDFNENGDGYDLEDCQYTITPVMMTEEEFNNLPDSD